MSTTNTLLGHELSNDELDAVSGGEPVTTHQSGGVKILSTPTSYGVSVNGAGWIFNWGNGTLCASPGGSKNVSCVQL